MTHQLITLAMKIENNSIGGTDLFMNFHARYGASHASDLNNSMKSHAINLFVIAIVLFYTTVHASDTVVDSFVTKYKEAKTEVQKRTICIDLIDAGVLYDGSPVADVKRVFQKDFMEQGMADNTNNRLAIVYFVPPDRSGGPMVSVFVTGWYLSLTYREADGCVVDYHLSNEGIDLNPAALRRQLEKQREKYGTNNDIGLPVLKPRKGQ